MYFDENNNEHAEYLLGTKESCFTDIHICTNFTFAFWVKITEPCLHGGGIIAAKAYGGGTRREGFQVYCYDTGMMR